MTVTHQDADAAFDRGDYATTLQLLRPLADQGDASAHRPHRAFNLSSMGTKNPARRDDRTNGPLWQTLMQNSLLRCESATIESA